jgi:hypothetical protein
MATRAQLCSARIAIPFARAVHVTINLHFIARVFPRNDTYGQVVRSMLSASTRRESNLERGEREREREREREGKEKKTKRKNKTLSKFTIVGIPVQ